MDRVTPELAHLIRMSETAPALWEYARDKAQSLAAQEPAVWNELPLLLKNALQSRKHGPRRQSIQPRSK